MERSWPCDLDCCKLCEKPTVEVVYKARGLCGTCFKRTQYRGNLRDYCRYSEDKMRVFDGRRTASREVADLVYCIRNVGVGEVADCLEVDRDEVNEWLNGPIPELYKEHLGMMKRAIQEEVYEFRYPEYEIDPWSVRGDRFYGILF